MSVSMKKIILYSHGGSGNHGCEAIVRSTIRIIGDKNVILISASPEEDRAYGVDQICTIIKDTNEKISKCSPDFWKAYAALKIRKNYIPMDKLLYKDAFSHVKKGDIALSIGGDNYCYEDVQKYIMLHDMMKKRGAKTVLFGCSIEPEIAKHSDISEDLRRYDLIVARESISYEALKEINTNTVLFSDPAFYLESRITQAPSLFSKSDTVGINLSPMAIQNESVPGMTMENYIQLVNFILSDTEMNVAFIPHVVWENGDDREPLRYLYNKYKDSGRVCLVEDRSCEELKYLISKCRFFVGARTHATIAAYSSGIPTLALAYSVKAIGIARDLFGTENGFAISVQKLDSRDFLLKAFKDICEKEHDIKKVLKDRQGRIENSYIHVRRSIIKSGNAEPIG